MKARNYRPLAWRLAAFTRRRTEGAGGFFGIERKRTILEGRVRGVLVVMAIMISA